MEFYLVKSEKQSDIEKKFKIKNKLYWQVLTGLDTV